MAKTRSSDELVISTQAVVSWIRESQFPITDKFVFRNNIVRELLAINRREAEMWQVGRDSRLAEREMNYAEIRDYGGFWPHWYSIPHYTEFFRWPEARDNWILERKQKLWLRLKAWHKRNRRRKEL